MDIESANSKFISDTKLTQYIIKMENLFCCTDLQPFRPRTVDHEFKFTSFMTWGMKYQNGTTASFSSSTKTFTYAIQLVKQVNYGALESKRYFVPVSGTLLDHVEIREQDLLDANFEKVNSYVSLFDPRL